MNSLLSQLTEIEALIKNYPELSEVMCNPDGNVWIEDKGTVIKTEYELQPGRVESIIRLLAGYYDLVVNREHPALSVKLPVFHGGRFQALVPPVVESPTFSIRFPPKKVFTLDNLLSRSCITEKQYTILEKAVLSHKNILIAGGTGSGKTTIANALLNLVTDERLIVIEDNPEIRTSSLNTVHMLTNTSFSVRDAV
ncbi:MAG: Flp pilus assembly complex ATPase component TadA, partial [Chitinivibrionales bacterium]|nr:Flp pilus assembly complex ATPase component TadA [Chitinivibrionales bacterium]